jgi:flavodoxin/ferredoxin
MAKILIVYFSLGGTTAKVAEAIADGLRTAGQEAELCNIRNQHPPFLDGYDALGIGTPAYYFRPPFNVTDYVDSLPSLKGLPAFHFVLHGTCMGDAGNAVRRALAQKQAREVGYFHCPGTDLFLGYLKEGYLFSPDQPDAGDLVRAVAFGAQVADCMTGQPYVKPPADPSSGLMYRLERFLVNRWLVRQVYSQMFMVDKKKCSACGLCRKECPVCNITSAEEDYPVWGRDCLLCLQCEMKCPQDAISSPVSLPFFRPTMLYNVQHASQDASLQYVRVQHRQGRTWRV